MIGPSLEALGYILAPTLFIAGLLSPEFFLAYTGLFFAFGVFLSVGSLVLEEMDIKRVNNARHLVVLFLIAIVENFGYRQINTYWRFRGWLQFFTGERGWGTVNRLKFLKPAD